MDAQKRFELITRNAEEVLTPEHLKWLLESKIKLKHYIGYEISGKAHLGSGVMAGMKIADLQKAGVDCSIYLATYHAWINNKFGGDLETIRNASAYFAESLKASVTAMGGDADKLSVVTGDELYSKNDDYWRQTIEIAKNLTLNRTLRAISIMGRESKEEVPLAFLFYPAMQVADIFIQGINICHSGMDQRKAHVIAIELAEKLKIKPLMNKETRYKPVAIHHHLLPGLQAPPIWPVPPEQKRELYTQLKMSKSVGGSAIFVDDGEEEIISKMNKAFCPEGETDYNPVLDWAKHLVLNRGKELHIDRPAKFGGPVTFKNFDELKNAFANRKLHPADLKKAMAAEVTALLAPVRKHFEKPKMQKLKEDFEKLAVTR